PSQRRAIYRQSLSERRSCKERVVLWGLGRCHVRAVQRCKVAQNCVVGLCRDFRKALNQNGLLGFIDSQANFRDQRLFLPRGVRRGNSWRVFDRAIVQLALGIAECQAKKTVFGKSSLNEIASMPLNARLEDFVDGIALSLMQFVSSPRDIIR